MNGNWRDRTDTFFSCRKQPASGSRGMVVSNALEVELAVPDAVRAKLTSMGHEVVAVPTVAGA
jgi:hypothetical protein